MIIVIELVELLMWIVSQHLFKCHSKFCLLKALQTPCSMAQLKSTSTLFGNIQSINRSLLLGARSRSALLTRKKSGAPVLAPPIKLERALAPAPEQLERAHFCAPLLILD